MLEHIHVKYLLFLSDFDETWIFSTDFRKKKAHISNSIKIRPVGAELFHAGGWKDGQRAQMTKLIVAFRNFSKEYKIVLISLLRCVIYQPLGSPSIRIKHFNFRLHTSRWTQK